MSGARQRKSLTQLGDGDMTAADVVDSLELDGAPIKERFSLIEQNGSLTMSIMSDAWRDCERSLDDPGRADQYYFPEKGVVLIDLNTGGD